MLRVIKPSYIFPVMQSAYLTKARCANWYPWYPGKNSVHSPPPPPFSVCLPTSLLHFCHSGGTWLPSSRYVFSCRVCSVLTYFTSAEDANGIVTHMHIALLLDWIFHWMMIQASFGGRESGGKGKGGNTPWCWPDSFYKWRWPFPSRVVHSCNPLASYVGRHVEETPVWRYKP